ncbi:MAG: hypothetical protein WCL71_10065 [Deltaproteobacteria bacterium]
MLKYRFRLVGAKQVLSASPAFGGNPGKGEAGEAFASPLRKTLNQQNLRPLLLLGTTFTKLELGNEGK